MYVSRGLLFSEVEDWEGPAFQTCMNAAIVANAFETSRRREVLSFTHHREVAPLSADWQDKLLDEAEMWEISENLHRTEGLRPRRPRSLEGCQSCLGWAYVDLRRITQNLDGFKLGRTDCAKAHIPRVSLLLPAACIC